MGLKINEYMNQTKRSFENLLVLHYKLCRAKINDLKEIVRQILDVLQFIEKYKLFPIDLSDLFREHLVLLCEGSSDAKKMQLEIISI